MASTFAADPTKRKAQAGDPDFQDPAAPPTPGTPVPGPIAAPGDAFPQALPGTMQDTAPGMAAPRDLPDHPSFFPFTDPNRPPMQALPGTMQDTAPGMAGGEGPGSGTTNGIPNSPAGGTPIGPQGSGDPLRDAFRKSLLDAMNAKTPTLDDPALKAQADAFSVGQTRATGRAREAMAERAAAHGQLSDQADSGAFDQGIVGLEQAQGEAESGFNADIVAKQIDAQRQQLMQAAAMAGNTLSAEDSRALQEKLAILDEQFRRASLGQQESQFGRTFGEQGRQFDADQALKRFGITQQGDQFGRDLDLRRFGIESQNQLGRDELGFRQRGLDQAGSQFDRQLGQQNDQFGKTLGFDISKFNETSSKDFMLALLRELGLTA